MIILVAALSLLPAAKAATSIGAAPEGDATAVASRIIKYNFPTCNKVTRAMRNQDGSIKAICDGVSYLVFTMYSSKQGKMLELALDCAAAKKHLNFTC